MNILLSLKTQYYSNIPRGLEIINNNGEIFINLFIYKQEEINFGHDTKRFHESLPNLIARTKHPQLSGIKKM